MKGLENILKFLEVKTWKGCYWYLPYYFQQYFQLYLLVVIVVVIMAAKEEAVADQKIVLMEQGVITVKALVT